MRPLWFRFWATPAAPVTLVMSLLFAASGVLMVFLPRWLEQARGLSGAEIGAVLSLSQAARIVTGPVIAYWADRAADARTPLRVVALTATLAYGAFFFFAHDFPTLLALGFVALSLSQAMTPLVEAAALRATAAGRPGYGVVRGIGSIAFIVATTAGGFLVCQFGVDAMIIWVLTALALTAFSSSAALLPDPQARAHPVSARGSLAALLGHRRFLIVIFACGLIQSGHAFYYGFSTLVWRGQGLSDLDAGLLWGFGVAVEVVFLWSLTPVERRLAPETLILAGAAGGMVRWVAMGFAPTGAWLWLLQGLHMLSFAATHVGALRLTYREAPPGAAAMAQTLNSALAGGLILAASTQLSGALYQTAGAQGYWAMAALSFAGGMLALTLVGRARANPQAGPGASSR